MEENLVVLTIVIASILYVGAAVFAGGWFAAKLYESETEAASIILAPVWPLALLVYWGWKYGIRQPKVKVKS